MYKNRDILTKRNERSSFLSINYQNFNPEFISTHSKFFIESSDDRRRNDTSEHSKQPNKSCPTKKIWGLDFYASVVGPRGSWGRLKILRPLRIRVNRSFSPPHLNESFPSSRHGDLVRMQTQCYGEFKLWFSRSGHHLGPSMTVDLNRATMKP